MIDLDPAYSSEKRRVALDPTIRRGKQRVEVTGVLREERIMSVSAKGVVFSYSGPQRPQLLSPSMRSIHPKNRPF